MKKILKGGKGLRGGRGFSFRVIEDVGVVDG
jgi:hypothetical protein